MVDRVRNVPLWIRGAAGFKVDPKLSGKWSWRYLDNDGYTLRICGLEFISESAALEDCEEYWRLHSIELQAAVNEASAKAAAQPRRVAPEYR